MFFTRSSSWPPFNYSALGSGYQENRKEQWNLSCRIKLVRFGINLFYLRPGLIKGEVGVLFAVPVLGYFRLCERVYDPSYRFRLLVVFHHNFQPELRLSAKKTLGDYQCSLFHCNFRDNYRCTQSIRLGQIHTSPGFCRAQEKENMDPLGDSINRYVLQRICI